MRGERSFYAPYINILPEKFNALPLWTIREVAELQESSSKIRQITKEALLLRQRYDFLKNEADALGLVAANKLTFSIYTWALMVVETRCFELTDGVQHALVPLADLLNHHPESPVTWHVSKSRFHLITRGGGFERGTQLFSNYGGDLRYV